MSTGVLAYPAATMRQRARKEPDPSEAADRKIKLIFDLLCHSLKTAKKPKETILAVRRNLLEIIKNAGAKS